MLPTGACCGDQMPHETKDAIRGSLDNPNDGVRIPLCRLGPLLPQTVPTMANVAFQDEFGKPENCPLTSAVPSTPTAATVLPDLFPLTNNPHLKCPRKAEWTWVCILEQEASGHRCNLPRGFLIGPPRHTRDGSASSFLAPRPPRAVRDLDPGTPAS